MEKNLNPVATIVIPSWDACALLRKTLPSVLAQQNISYEIIVVDNGSPNNDTEKLIENFATPILHYHKLPYQAGYTGAVNEGVRVARTNLVAVLGNDNIVPPNWLKNMVSYFQKNCLQESSIGDRSPGKNTANKRVGAVMSQTIVSGNIPSGACTLNFFGRNIFYDLPTWNEKVFPTFYPGGNAFLFDKTIFPEPFCTEYFAYHEDVSLGWRIQNKGMQVLQLPEPHVQSFDGGSTKRKSIRFRTLFLTERNRWINLLVFPEKQTMVKLLPLWILDSLAACIFGKHKRAKVYAWLWILWNWKWIRKLRNLRQAERTVGDNVALQAMSYNYFSFRSNENKFVQWLKKMVNAWIKIFF